MQLPKDETAVRLAGERFEVKARHAFADGRDGVLTLAIEDQQDFETREMTLRLDPWTAAAFEVHDWPGTSCVLIAGSHRFVLVDLEAREVKAVMGLEYEEVDTVGTPWVVAQGDVLLVATPRRIWCLDARRAIRATWSARTSEVDRWIVDAPAIEGDAILVPVRTRRGDAVARLTQMELEEMR